MDKNALLMANRNLSASVTQMRKELDELHRYKESYDLIARDNRRLNAQMQKKRRIARIEGTKDGNLYALMITAIHDTDEGVFVEVALP